MQLKSSRFYITLLGAALIVTGFSLKKSSYELEEDDYQDQDTIDSINLFGIFFYLIGWFFMIHGISTYNSGFMKPGLFKKDNYRGMLALASGIVVVVSEVTMNGMRDKGEEIPDYLPVIFSAGLIGVGYSAAMKEANDFFSLNLSKSIFAAVGVASILFSKFYILPQWDLIDEIYDDFGMPLYSFGGMGGLIMAASLM